MNKEEKKEQLNASNVFEIIKDIETNYQVDSIKLSDGTRIWNLLRITLIFYPRQLNLGSVVYKINSFLNFIIESFSTIKHTKKTDFCGFSHTESRRLREGKYYDIYMDPLYRILGDNFTVFEWPDEKGYRRRYNSKIYSKNYVPIHVPILSKAFWNIVFYKLFGKKHFEVKHIAILDEILKYIADKYSTDEKRLKKHVYDSVAVFVFVKDFLAEILKKKRPKAVFMRCGYGRFHMALSQACRELGIPSIEVQHGIIQGIITDRPDYYPGYHPGYVKTVRSQNRDCIPEYFLTYGNYFTDIVKSGYLFDPKKVVTIGFPHLEDVKNASLQLDKETINFQKKHSRNILFTPEYSQYLASLVERFTSDLSKKLLEENMDVGIIFKPHPLDKKDWSHLEKNENVYVEDKHADTYELFKVSDAHSTVFSTCALEALAFEVPNIIIEVEGGSIANMVDIVDDKSSFIVKDVDQYIQKLKVIFSDYNKYSKNALQESRKYFEYNAISNIKKFMNRIK